MAFLAQRLADQGVLRPELSGAEAADLLWVLTSFDSFDLRYAGRSLSADQVADPLVATADLALLR